jgi:hypothetical protein
MQNEIIHQFSSKEGVVKKRAIRTKFVVLLLGLILVLLSVSVAAAAPPLKLQIVVDEYINLQNKPFTASGPAVDSGAICASGTVSEVSSPFGPSQGNYILLNIRKEFVCGDGSGTFYIKMKAKLDANGFTTANWKFDGGTLNYVNLKGNGKLVGDPTLAKNDILDVYDGRVH